MMVAPMPVERHTGVTKSQVSNSCLTMVTAAKAINLFTLQLVLNPLPIRRVTDKRKHRTNALDQERTLSGFGVIKGSLRKRASVREYYYEHSSYLNAVVPVRITKKLLQTRAVQ